MRAIKLLFATTALLLGSHAMAQAWPAKPVTLIVSTGSSSGSDIIARLIQPRLQQMWGQPVVVENRVGASGSIGTTAVARAAPDGYTILMTPSTITMLASLVKSTPWDPEKSFEPVSLIAYTLLALAVNADLPVKSVSELIALARSKPGQLNYVTPGSGTPQHLSAELFKQVNGLEIVHVPYKSLPAANTDLAGGRGQMGMLGLSSIMPLVRAGKIRVLATHGDARAAATPDVPTFKELGMGSVAADQYIAAFVPKGTAKDAYDRIVRDFVAISNRPDFQAELVKQDLVPTKDPSPAGLAAALRRDVPAWRKVIEVGKIEAD